MRLQAATTNLDQVTTVKPSHHLIFLKILLTNLLTGHHVHKLAALL